MGIDYRYRRMAESELEALEVDSMRAINVLLGPPGIDIETWGQFMSNPAGMSQEENDKIRAALMNPSADSTQIDLGRDWHAVHFLLTGDSSMNPRHEPDDPLWNVVLGGHPTGIPMSYGPVRCLSQVDISEIFRALSSIADEQLLLRASVAAFNERKIYPDPQPGGWSEDEVRSVYEVIPRIKTFFENALDANEVIVVYAT